MSWTRRAPLENGARVRERAAVPVAAPSEAPVAALVTAARAGDRAAFAALYHRFARVVHAIALARVRAADAGDVVQDVFLVAYERLGELRDPAAFPGWLVQIARNRAVDRARAPRGVDATADASIDPAPTAEAREALDAIRALPEAYRETLIMRLVEGLTGPEIAERTGLAPGSVRVNLHRGMMILRERLGAAPAGDREGEGEP
jgi:RNA polymerase sigma-70 factor (ECF subfamily)